MTYFFITIVILIIVAILMFRYLNQCPHGWVLIREYDIIRTTDDKLVGGGKIYECCHCKKIKKVEF